MFKLSRPHLLLLHLELLLVLGLELRHGPLQADLGGLQNLGIDIIDRYLDKYRYLKSTCICPVSSSTSSACSLSLFSRSAFCLLSFLASSSLVVSLRSSSSSRNRLLILLSFVSTSSRKV